jgi:uncharacterized membrane protein
MLNSINYSGVANILSLKSTGLFMVRTQTPTRTRGWSLKELIVMGFGEKHRALEVLPQLQRLQFEWSADLQNAVAVEVEQDGRLRLLQNQLLDPADDSADTHQWKALLSSIVPMPHVLAATTKERSAEVRAINLEGGAWLKDLALDQDFVRNAAALLRPGNSAILATVQDWQTALPVLCGFSHIVLRTALARPEVSPKPAQ